MKVEVEKLVHIVINEEESAVLTKAMELLRDIYDELDEDVDIGNKAYDAAQLIDSITDEVCIQ